MKINDVSAFAASCKVAILHKSYRFHVRNTLFMKDVIMAVSQSINGLISSFEEKDNRILIRLNEGISFLDSKRISMPSVKIYSSYKDLKRYVSKYGYIFLSTDLGIIDHRQAQKKKKGGMLLFGIQCCQIPRIDN